MDQTPGFVDAFQPREIAQRVETLGVSKAKANILTLFVLAVLAGAFISLGALFYVFVMTKSELGFGVTRMLSGVAFSLGLILVVIGGAELFTGNNLIAMAWASRRITTADLLRNWSIVYVGNVVGCLGTVLLVVWSDLGSQHEGAVRETVVQMVRSKTALAPEVAFARGILCNSLVCLAVWLAIGGHSVADKILAMVFPVTAFVAIGSEHSIANWFLLPLGMAWDRTLAHSVGAMLVNLACVTMGNIVGGSLLVAGVYWLAYLRGNSPSSGQR